MNNVNDLGIKIIFLGTPEFAVPILETLINSEFRPVAVFCAPDKPIGRHQISTPPPTKIITQKYNIPVYQPIDKSSLKSYIFNLKSDLIITAAYGLILPKEILELPKYGCLNIHPSLLPKYRGASPIQYTILNGDTETGVSIMKMVEKIDAGPIIANRLLPIANCKYTAPELSQILSNLSANLLLKILPDYLASKIKPKSQNESSATYTKIIKKEDGNIDWQKSAVEIERQIRAFTLWPSAQTKINGESETINLKILGADSINQNSDKKLGEIFLFNNNQLAVQTKDGILIILRLQIEGGKPLSAAEFIRGHQDIIGQTFN